MSGCSDGQKSKVSAFALEYTLSLTSVPSTTHVSAYRTAEVTNCLSASALYSTGGSSVSILRAEH